MKKLLISISGYLFLTCSLLSQNFVSNIKADADEEKVVISYDLMRNGSHAFFNVCLVSSDPAIRPRDVTGALGKNINAGVNKKIIWYYPNDQLTQAQIGALKLNVIAIDPLSPPTNTTERPKYVPAYAGLGGTMVLSAGILVIGLVKEADAQKIYDRYVADPTRTDLYEDANPKHKKAQWMMVGSGVVLTGAGIILAKRISVIKRLKRNQKPMAAPGTDCAQSFITRWQILPETSAAYPIGIGLIYHF